MPRGRDSAMTGVYVRGTRMEEEEERTQENKKEKGKCKREREKQRRMHEAMSRKRENAGLPSAISHAKERERRIA